MGCTGSCVDRVWVLLGNKYEIGEKLGEGGFGQVRAAYLRYPREPRAIKILLLGKKAGKKVKVDKHKKAAAIKEASIWKALGNHEHVVRFYEAFRKDTVFYMVMERCARTLLAALISMPNTDECDMARIFKEMFLGVAHMHSLRIVHADIKLANYLFGGLMGDTVKIADFGLAAFLPETPVGGDPAKLEGAIGTGPYMAPEMINFQGYDRSADLWSLGVTVYLLLMGEYPYETEGATGSGHPAPRYRRCDDLTAPSETSVDLVRRLFVREPDQRPSIEQALQDPFLSMFLQESMSSKTSLGAVFARAQTIEFDLQEKVVDEEVQCAIDRVVFRHASRSPACSSPSSAAAYGRNRSNSDTTGTRKGKAEPRPVRSGRQCRTADATLDTKKEPLPIGLGPSQNYASKAQLPLPGQILTTADSVFTTVS